MHQGHLHLDPGSATAVAAHAPPSPAIRASRVCSYNEWDPLEEVIVGTVDGACLPPWHVSVSAPLPASQRAYFEANGGRPFPAEAVDAARRELDHFSALLQREGIRVRRPQPRDKQLGFGAPGWTSTGLYDAMPRDGLLVVGQEIIECPMAWRSRYFESSAYRPLLKEYFAAGARWSAAPRPELPDELYDADWTDSHRKGSGPRLVISEFEPTFDAADFIRCGRDIFAQQSHVTNRFGIDWLQRQLGSDYRVHVCAFDDANPMHIDATLMPLAPGKLLVHPERVSQVPDLFREWQVLRAPPPAIPPEHPMYMSSRWMNINVLMLDPGRVVVEAQDQPMIEAMTRWGFDVLPCPFRQFNSFGGSFHCATLDVRRQGTLQSYF